MSAGFKVGAVTSDGFSVAGVGVLAGGVAAASASRSARDLPAPSSCARRAFSLSCFSVSMRCSSSSRRFFASSPLSRFSRITLSCTFTGSSASGTGGPASGRAGICCCHADCCENTGCAGSVLAICGDARMSWPATILPRRSGADDMSEPLDVDTRLI